MWYKLFCADGLFYKRNSPDKRPFTEAKVNEVGTRHLSMHACKINSAQKLLHDVTYGYHGGFLLVFDGSVEMPNISCKGVGKAS